MKLVIVYVICVLLLLSIPKRYTYICLFFNSIMIASISYIVTTENQYDLIFHLDLYQWMVGKDLGSVIKHYYFAQSPLYVLYVYCLGFLRNPHLLPAVSTFIGYFSFSNMVYYFFKHENSSKSKLITVYLLVLFTLPWQDFAAGIRGALSFTVCCWAIFFDLIIGRKKVSVCFYVAAIFIHQSAVIAILIRMALYLTNRIKKQQFGIVCVLVLLMSTFSELIGLLAERIAGAIGLEILSVVAHSFSSHTSRANGIYELGPVIVRVAIILMVFYIIKRCGIEVSKESVRKRNIDVIRYFTLLACATLSYIWQYDIVCRYSVICVLLLPMVLYCIADCPTTYTLGRLADSSLAVIVIPVAVFTLSYYYIIYYSKWSFGV